MRGVWPGNAWRAFVYGGIAAVCVLYLGNCVVQLWEEHDTPAVAAEP